MSKGLPLIVVLGASACGKSKLAIELAARFGAEVISADSMQVYRGLDIATNKVTEEEQQQIKHHMMNFVDPTQNYSVIDFRNRALGIINNLLDEQCKKIPIIVGGTNYYIESLLWKGFTLERDKSQIEEQVTSQKREATMLDDEIESCQRLPQGATHTDEDFEDVDKFFSKPIYPTSFGNTNPVKLWQILEKVDPETAHIYHPNNRRGIIRSLQVYQEKKRKYSEIIKDLNKSIETGGSSLGGPLRFVNTCVLWLSCEEEMLNKILDERVDQMLERGLLAELENFHEAYNKLRITREERADYTMGIFQTIGFKEFHSYFALDAETRESEKGKNILKQCITEMKTSTRQYVRKQLKWIKSRFLRSGLRDLPPLFKLTTSFDEDGWIKQVREPAFKIVESILEGKPLGDEVSSLKPDPVEGSAFNPGKFHCEICDRLFIGTVQIEEHLKSKRHERMRYKKRKVEV